MDLQRFMLKTIALLHYLLQPQELLLLALLMEQSCRKQLVTTSQIHQLLPQNGMHIPQQVIIRLLFHPIYLKIYV